MTEYLLLSKRTRQVFETDAGTAWNPSNRPRIGHELGPLLLEDLPDRLVGELGMRMRLGVGDALVEQPGVQLVVGFEPQPRREEALAHEADLVLDLALLPARGRRAGDRLDQIMRAHLLEAAVVEAILADEDRLHRRLHVVVDAALRRRP